MSFGPTGLVVQTTGDIRAAIRAELRIVFGDSVQTGPDTVFGQLIDIFAGYLGDANQLLQAVYDSFRPQAAEGVNLESLAAITGTYREAARPSSVVLVATGTPGVIIPPGFQARVDGGVTFQTSTSATIGVGGTVEVSAEALVTGPITAAPNTVEVIVTPIAGLASVTNPAAAAVGRNLESDFELRARRASGQQGESEATVPAIRAGLLALAIVDQCVVINNRTDFPDVVTGLPPHSVRAIVYPDPGPSPADDDIFITLLNKVAAGIQTDGTRSAVVNDSQGQPQTFSYSVATELDLFVRVEVEVDDDYPGDGEDQIKTQVAAYVNGFDFDGNDIEDEGGGLSVGQTFVNFKCVCAVAKVAGLVDITVFARVGVPPIATDTGNITPAFDEIFRVFEADIDVVVL